MPLNSPARAWLLDRLSARHAELERALLAETARPVPDDAALRRLKREKLLIRDRIAAIERGAMPPWAVGGRTIPGAPTNLPARSSA